MGAITVRNLDEKTKRELRMRAARNGRSMEEEVRRMIRYLLDQPETETPHVVDVAREIVERTGGFEIELPPRQKMREPPSFD